MKYLTLITISALIVGLWVVLIAANANAQTGFEFLISWQADSYIPDWYAGKSLPVAGASIQINFELINDGKPVNLSQNIVRWYVDGNLVQNENNGLGIKSLITAIPKNSNNEALVKISIIDYADSVLEKTFIIPISKPEAVIDSPYPGNKIESGLSVFRLIPFFFNIDNLNSLAVKWSANNIDSQSYADNLWQLNLNIGGQISTGTKIILGAVIRNPLNQLESANAAIMMQKK